MFITLVKQIKDITLGLFVVYKWFIFSSECFDATRNKWFRYDDEIVKEINIKSLDYEKKGSNTAYILFY